MGLLIVGLGSIVLMWVTFCLLVIVKKTFSGIWTLVFFCIVGLYSLAVPFFIIPKFIYALTVMFLCLIFITFGEVKLRVYLNLVERNEDQYKERIEHLEAKLAELQK